MRRFEAMNSMLTLLLGAFAIKSDLIFFQSNKSFKYRISFFFIWVTSKTGTILDLFFPSIFIIPQAFSVFFLSKLDHDYIIRADTQTEIRLLDCFYWKAKMFLKLAEIALVSKTSVVGQESKYRA